MRGTRSLPSLSQLRSPNQHLIAIITSSVKGTPPSSSSSRAASPRAVRSRTYMDREEGHRRDESGCDRGGPHQGNSRGDRGFVGAGWPHTHPPPGGQLCAGQSIMKWAPIDSPLRPVSNIQTDVTAALVDRCTKVKRIRALAWATQTLWSPAPSHPLSGSAHPVSL